MSYNDHILLRGFISFLLPSYWHSVIIDERNNLGPPKDNVAAYINAYHLVFSVSEMLHGRVSQSGTLSISIATQCPLLLV